MKIYGYKMPLLLISTVFMVINVAAGFRCHENYTMITPTKCVRYHSERVSYDEARSVCQAYPGGNLVSIHSQAEQGVIESLLPINYSSTYSEADDVWIGLNDMAQEENPEWTDGTTTDFTYYVSGEPNNGCGLCGATGDANCFRMSPESAMWTWGDKQCHLHARFVCQRPVIGLKVTTLHVDVSHTSLNTKGSSQDHLRCARSCAQGSNCAQVQMEDDLKCSETAGGFVNTGRPVWEVESEVED